MKTWWDYAAFLVILYLLPFVVGILPTVERFGRFWGGGPVRQFALNFVSSRMPADKAEILVNKFNDSTTLGEVLIYLPIALNVSLLLLIVGYFIGFLSIEINNYIRTNVYKSKRDKAKGK
jgi:hypothetical protein